MAAVSTSEAGFGHITESSAGRTDAGNERRHGALEIRLVLQDVVAQNEIESAQIQGLQVVDAAGDGRQAIADGSRVRAPASSGEQRRRRVDHGDGVAVDPEGLRPDMPDAPVPRRTEASGS